MSDARKTLTIPASELRVGDHVINYGVVTAFKAPGADDPVQVTMDGFGFKYWRPDRLLTIERHEPEVIVRYFEQDADALSALPSVGELSSAPVDAGVEELAKRLEDRVGGFVQSNGEVVEIIDHEARDAAQMLRILSRQLTTERQAWAKVREKIMSNLYASDGLMDGFMRGWNAAKLQDDAILAQHAPKEG